MFSKRSIRINFLFKLIFASISLIFIFSSLLYLYIENSIYEDKHQELLQYAKNISNNKSIFEVDADIQDMLLGIDVGVIKVKKTNDKTGFYETTQDTREYLTLLYPFNTTEQSYLKITKEITYTKRLLDKILRYIFIINIVGFVLVIVYAIALSKMLIAPIETISSRLSNMNEHLIKPIKTEELQKSLNHLEIL
jgi:two-component system OmpR family sensor kinase